MTEPQNNERTWEQVDSTPAEPVNGPTDNYMAQHRTDNEPATAGTQEETVQTAAPTPTTEVTPTAPVAAPVLEQTAPQPVDAAHPVAEDPEQHMGEETPDPWSDPAQTDWKQGELDLPGTEG